MLAPVAWVVLYLVLIDLAINLIFAYPKDPRDTSPSKLQQYFEYGRSVEGKLARMTRETNEASAPIAMWGWLGGDAGWRSLVPTDNDTRPLVSVYGMSHAQLLAKDMAVLDPSMRILPRAAPLGVPTWAFSAFRADRSKVRSDVAVLAVMTSTVSLLATTAGTTMYFDGAYPYTYPRYRVDHGVLGLEEPPFATIEDYRRYFFDPALWREYLGWLAGNDKFYDALLFRANALDRSSIVRLLRRSYATATRASRQAKVYDEAKGFDESSEEVIVLKAIIVEFARQARQDKTVPVVYLVNSLRTGDRLFRLLEPTLATLGIAYLSSHEICSPDDPRNYLPDSHFEPSKNMGLARAMNEIVRRALARPPP
jgi:hypothetical protein